ncbi:diguanylate cyclase [Desulforhopalus vacuolatus]|uniref:sensor domain-containing diguanylate cyclase n=1 Tax=Desulforhopalus vacuolatus TaxID=40414 RepID=UPI0019636EF9|nr:diguanylate cyclase [Desulforhopalus vacuolatus]MBM9518718.1 diguanylate cyclase [Desulforhopalus vacuolatus]
MSLPFETETFPSQTRYRLRFIFSFLSFGILLIAMTIAVLYSRSSQEIHEQIRQDYQFALEQRRFIFTLTKELEETLSGLQRSPFLTRFLEMSTPATRQRLIELFLFTVEDHPDYMQVRYLDSKGNEVIRINQRKAGQAPQIVSDNGLQNKSGHSYFTRTMELPEGDFWRSDIDLNREKGRIEVPWQPTLRVAVSIFHNGRRRGIIIINMLLEPLLQRLVKSQKFTVFLIDYKGNYIYSVDPHLCWSVQLATGRNMLRENEMDALNLSEGRDIEVKGFYFNYVGKFLENSQHVFLVFKEKGEYLSRLQQVKNFTQLWMLFFLLAVSIPLAWVLSGYPLQLQRKLRDTVIRLQKFDIIIDRFVMVLHVEKDGRIIDATSAFRRQLKLDPDEVTGLHYANLFECAEKEIGQRNKGGLADILKAKELKGITGDGRSWWVTQTVSGEHNGEENFYTIILTDITQRKVVEKMAVTDSLTGVSNRMGIDNFLRGAFALAERNSTPFSFIIADIDFFKIVNDSLGHQAGDDVLKELAQIFRTQVRASDLVGRFGGEEFVFILLQTRSGGAVAFAGKLRQLVEDFKFSPGCPLTISFGVAQYHPGDTAESLLKRADSGLYEAKESGRNRVVFKDVQED